jgi:hypothetical protein
MVTSLADLKGYIDKWITEAREKRDLLPDSPVKQHLHGAIDALQAVRKTAFGESLPPTNGGPAVEFVPDEGVPCCARCMMLVCQCHSYVSYYRADGKAICSQCGMFYNTHPIDKDWDWLNVLCDGERVKL